MKTKKIKRVLAFFLAVVFAFSTCMTASPYTVQATEEPKLSVNVTLGDGVSTFVPTIKLTVYLRIPCRIFINSLYKTEFNYIP